MSVSLPCALRPVPCALSEQQGLIAGPLHHNAVSERFVPGNYILASMVLSAGLFVDYICVLDFGAWLAAPDPMTLFWTVVFGLLAVVLIAVGLAGFLMRYDREARFLEDRIVLPSGWKFEKDETVIPLGRVWKFYSNLKNDFPAVFVVWRDERDRCRWTTFDKEEVEDFPARVARLGERIPVDNENYAIAEFVRKDVRASLGCEPAL